MTQPRRVLPATGRGYQPHEVVSALQKAIRRSQIREAVYWAVELWESNYQNWCWARLIEILSEDIGPADRYLPATIGALERSSKDKLQKKGAGAMEMVHAVILMASAKKSRFASQAVMLAASDNHERLEIPDEALDRHTRRGRAMGRGLENFLDEAAKLVQPPDDPEDFHAWFDEIAEEVIRLNRDRRLDPDADVPDNPWRKHGEASDRETSWIPAKEPDQGSLLVDPDTGEVKE
jgi:hypothetical protein